MLERIRTWRKERKQRREETAYADRMEHLAIAYLLDNRHKNTGWSDPEFADYLNGLRKDQGKKPLHHTQVSYIVWKYVGEKALEPSRRVKNYPRQFRLSRTGREEVQPVIDLILQEVSTTTLDDALRRLTLH